MWHLMSPAEVTLFGTGCAAAGATLSVVVTKLLRRRRKVRPTTTAWIDSGLDSFYADKARDWASRRGTPGLSDFAHSRLRLAHHLAERYRDRLHRQ